MAAIPASAEIVVVGGGAVGCAAAYSLMKAGRRDIVVLERGEALASATTSQAAGLVGQVRSSLDRVRLAMWSVATFSELEQDGEVRPGWRQVGSLRIALTEERAQEFQRLSEVCRTAGLEVETVDAARAERLWPGMKLGRASSILWCPSDGYLQPYDLTMAYQHRSRQQGVRYATRTLVTGIRLRNGRVSGVQTDQGTIECSLVVNAAGAHAFHVAKMVGLELPIVPVRHEYFVSVPVANIAPTLPCFRVPDATLYGRAEVNSLLLGGWEPAALSTPPQDFSLSEEPPRIRDDWEVLGWFGEQLAPLFPAVESTGVRTVFKGWPTFTPDGRFIVGESSQVPGFVMAGGCNAHGVSGSAGIGRHLVESLLEKEPSAYVRSLSPDRFAAGTWDWPTARTQAQHVYETYYALGH
jgi:glycine/D-amino acid oxidase-like deaminating enzyme